MGCRDSGPLVPESENPDKNPDKVSGYAESTMTFKFTESVVEEACLQYFGQLRYNYLPGAELTGDDGQFALLRQGEAVQDGDGPWRGTGAERRRTRLLRRP